MRLPAMITAITAEVGRRGRSRTAVCVQHGELAGTRSGSMPASGLANSRVTSFAGSGANCPSSTVTGDPAAGNARRLDRQVGHRFVAVNTDVDGRFGGGDE
jgi:hypothetical protein